MPPKNRNRTQLTDRQRGIVIEAIQTGSTLESAAALAEMRGGLRQLQDAIRDSPSLAIAVRAANARHEQQCLRDLSKSARGADLRWLLESRHGWGGEKPALDLPPPTVKVATVSTYPEGLEAYQRAKDA